MGGGRWEGGTKWKGHVYTYDRFMLMYGKKKSQYCKVIILQFKIKYKKNSTTTNAGEGVKRREPSRTIGGSVNWYSHYEEQYAGSLKN